MPDEQITGSTENASQDAAAPADVPDAIQTPAPEDQNFPAASSDAVPAAEAPVTAQPTDTPAPTSADVSDSPTSPEVGTSTPAEPVAPAEVATSTPFMPAAPAPAPQINSLPPQPAPAINPPAAPVAAPQYMNIKSLLGKALAAIQFRKQAKLEKIMKHVAAKGFITNDEAQKLLRISHATAARYLRQLVREGRLKEVGTTELRRYEIPGVSNGAV